MEEDLNKHFSSLGRLSEFIQINSDQIISDFESELPISEGIEVINKLNVDEASIISSIQ